VGEHDKLGSARLRTRTGEQGVERLRRKVEELKKIGGATENPEEAKTRSE
jgi:hypothetical protein